MKMSKRRLGMSELKREEQKKINKKRLVNILVRTAIDIPTCEEVIRNCIEKLDPSKFEIVYSVERSNIKVFGGTVTTYVFVAGDIEGGLVRSGMEALCNCLKTSGYYIHFVPCCYSFIPSRD
jgi:hypothetical protein